MGCEWEFDSLVACTLHWSYGGRWLYLCSEELCESKHWKVYWLMVYALRGGTLTAPPFHFRRTHNEAEVTLASFSGLIDLT